MTDIPHIDEYRTGRMPDGHWIDCHGCEVWVKDRRYHRVDGPAVTYRNGLKLWYFNGAWHTFEDWLKANNEITDEQRVMLKLEYGK